MVHTIYSKVGGYTVFKSNVEANTFKGLDGIKSLFWKKVLCTWLNNNIINNVREVSIYSPIFNNKNVTYKNQTLYIPQCYQSKIYAIKDIMKGTDI